MTSLPVVWAPDAIERALAELIAVLDDGLSPNELLVDPPMTLMCAIDCLRAILAGYGDDTPEVGALARLLDIEDAALAYVRSDPPRPEWKRLVEALGFHENDAADRRVVLLEGVPTTDGRLIRPGAITWPDHELPLWMELEDPTRGPAQVGVLVDPRREGKLITCEVVLSEGVELPDDWVPSIDLRNMMCENEGSFSGQLVIAAGELAGAHVLPWADWAWTLDQIAEASGA